MEMRDIIVKHALQNATKFRGKANLAAVLGKVFAEMPSLRDNAKNVIKEANKVILEINSLSAEEQIEKLKGFALEEFKKEVEDERDIFGFLNIKGEVITAFPPEPSKYPHIGHAKSIILNYELAKKYNGKFILRFEDTNPKLAKKEFYDIHIKDYEWLGVKADKIEYASDYMVQFYEQGRKLIEVGKAYICSCKQPEIKKNRFEGIECKCRAKESQLSLKEYDELLKKKKAERVLRLKGDMKHKNTTIRDPTLMRVITYPHPRTKREFTFWPTYDFENAVMDGLERVTYRLRSKEFELRNELQRYLQGILGFHQTKIFEFARFNLEGVESSGRIIRQKIKNKELIGWDDPCLTTLAALRRRGFLPEAIKNFVISSGITKAESVLTWEDLISQNRKLLDSRCNRFFFVHAQKKIVIKNAPNLDINLKLHPEFKERGFRRFTTSNKFYVNSDDFNVFKENGTIRLMDCLNFKAENNEFVFDSLEYENFKKNGKLIIHWLPYEKELVKVEVMMPNKEIKKGLAESMIKSLKVNDIVQFVRFGFCRLDEKKANKIKFWFSHK